MEDIMNTWIIVTNAGPVSTMVAASRALGGVTIVAVGPRELADTLAVAGADKVVWIDCGADVPAEAHATTVAELVASAAPELLLIADHPASRVLAAAAAVRIDAAWVPAMHEVSAEGQDLLISGPALEGRVTETLRVGVPAVAIFAGRDENLPACEPASVERMTAGDTDGDLTLISSSSAPTAGLASASRVIGIGRGVRSRGDLPLVEELAATLGAEIACTLPVSEDLHWFGAEHVIGRSGQRIKPELYLALGISGQPQHQDGIRDARVVVAVNNDPKAPIFRRARYGIVADLYDVVPALQSAFSQETPPHP
ncbi:electron transfer flavoprotein subunit alpha/FixB family protein [Propionibacterium australiense]|uniref:Electron transfer flavoprotein subunit alpha/FixB family protein n=2 Tax=Propionibacterium australiense TaxID=119981 RepID=A0A8B3FKW3_9ACTN|nr:electron transfer flavoprotein subunit alpha/FixB family protein [Propionibacterium australiense]